MKNKKFCSKLSTYLKTYGIYKQEDFQAVLMAAGETDTMQESIQDWLEWDGDPEFLTEEEVSAVIFFYYLHQHYLYY